MSQEPVDATILTETALFSKPNQINFAFPKGTQVASEGERWRVNGTLQEGAETKGGDSIVASVSQERAIIRIPGINRVLTGLQIENLEVGGRPVTDSDCRIYIGVQIGDGDGATYLNGNYASKGSKTILLERLRSREDVYALEHEKGHIKDEGFDDGGYIEKSQKLEGIVRAHLRGDGTIDGRALTSDEEFRQLLKYIMNRENAADKLALANVPEEEREQAEKYLDSVKYHGYLAYLGQELLDELGEDGILELMGKMKK